jgi:hypothetical protein
VIQEGARRQQPLRSFPVTINTTLIPPDVSSASFPSSSLSVLCFLFNKHHLSPLEAWLTIIIHSIALLSANCIKLSSNSIVYFQLPYHVVSRIHRDTLHTPHCRPCLNHLRNYGLWRIDSHDRTAASFHQRCIWLRRILTHSTIFGISRELLTATMLLLEFIRRYQTQHTLFVVVGVATGCGGTLRVSTRCLGLILHYFSLFDTDCI